MKIRTRLAIAFVTITVVPIVLIFVAAFGLVNYQEHLFQKTYGLSEQIDLLSGNQTQVFNRLTQGIQEEIREAVGENTDLFEEPAYLSKVNEELRDKYSYLVIRKGKDITFCGSEDGRELCERLAPYGDQGSMAGSIYMDGEEQHLVKQIDFRFSDDSRGLCAGDQGAARRDAASRRADHQFYGRSADHVDLPFSAASAAQAAGGDQADPGWKSGLYARCG